LEARGGNQAAARVANPVDDRLLVRFFLVEVLDAAGICVHLAIRRQDRILIGRDAMAADALGRSM
jgi:hypothetical protein